MKRFGVDPDTSTLLKVGTPSFHILKANHTHDGSGWCWYINANMTGVY